MRAGLSALIPSLWTQSASVRLAWSSSLELWPSTLHLAPLLSCSYGIYPSLTFAVSTVITCHLSRRAALWRQGFSGGELGWAGETSIDIPAMQSVHRKYLLTEWMNFKHSMVSLLFQRFWAETEKKNKGSFVRGLSLLRAPLRRAWCEPLSQEGSSRVSLPSPRGQHGAPTVGRI